MKTNEKGMLLWEESWVLLPWESKDVIININNQGTTLRKVCKEHPNLVVLGYLKHWSTPEQIDRILG